MGRVGIGYYLRWICNMDVAQTFSTAGANRRFYFHVSTYQGLRHFGLPCFCLSRSRRWTSPVCFLSPRCSRHRQGRKLRKPKWSKAEAAKRDELGAWCLDSCYRHPLFFLVVVFVFRRNEKKKDGSFLFPAISPCIGLPSLPVGHGF